MEGRARCTPPRWYSTDGSSVEGLRTSRSGVLLLAGLLVAGCGSAGTAPTLGTLAEPDDLPRATLLAVALPEASLNPSVLPFPVPDGSTLVSRFPPRRAALWVGTRADRASLGRNSMRVSARRTFQA